MLFKSYILACIKLMINACTIMVNLRLNVSLRRLATSKYNILFFFLLVAKQPWRMKLWGRLKTLKKNLYFKTILFKASRQTFLSQKIIPVKTICTGRRRYLRDFENSRICGVACIADTQIKDSFTHNSKPGSSQHFRNRVSWKFYLQNKKVVQNIILLVKIFHRVCVVSCLKHYRMTFKGSFSKNHLAVKSIRDVDFLKCL